MKTRKELALKDCVKQLNAIQENLIANKAFSVSERVEIVNYIDSVKVEMQNKLIK